MAARIVRLERNEMFGPDVTSDIQRSFRRKSSARIFGQALRILDISRFVPLVLKNLCCASRFSTCGGEVVGSRSSKSPRVMKQMLHSSRKDYIDKALFSELIS